MKKILIVDDEPMMLKLADRALRDHFETILASSGAEAVELFVSNAPDMVLSDLKMPSMSGYDLQSIVNKKSDRTVPFIFMTADESDESESKGFEQGAADYIRKPIKAELLLKRIERIFDNVDENKRLREAAKIDAMTGLLNKAATEAALEGICSRKSGMLLVLDLDSFKLVNDMYGHEMGDRILIRFAELIKAVIREKDTAGRIGGDEFVVFCENLSDESAIKEKTAFLNEEILKSAKEYMGSNMDIPLGCSGGAIIVPGSGESYVTLFAKADSALYKVKQNGKHGCMIYENVLETVKDNTPGGFSNLRMIFGERNMGRGAVTADKDTFRNIYQFLLRVIANYKWDIRLVVFTFEGANEADVAASPELFIEVAGPRLRCSDVLMKFGTNQVVMLILKVTEENYTIPVLRTLDAWEQKGKQGVNVTYEAERLDGKPDRPDDDESEGGINSCLKAEEMLLPEWMVHEPLLDVKEGLRNSETADAYVSSIEIFLEHVNGNIADLQMFFVSEDIENYTIKVHGLKSTSKIIGAMKLSSMAAAMERAGNDGNFDFIRDGHEEFLETYRHYADILTKNMEKGVKEELSQDKLEDAMLALKEFAGAEDYSLVEMTVDSLQAYDLPEEESRKISEIKENLLKLDWDRIHEIIG